MDPIHQRRGRVRQLALWCAALMLAITSLSAYIRLSQSGLGCEPWPACFGSHLRAAQRAVPPPSGDSLPVQVARLAHRLVATAALAGVATLAALCLLARPRLWRAGLVSLVLVALALGLAVLGLGSSGARTPAVVMGNLLGGMAMLALCWRLAAPEEGPDRRATTSMRVLAVTAAFVLLGQIALGALTSASYAGQSCLGLAECLRAADAAHGPWHTFDPWREPVWQADGLPLNPAAAPVQLAHRAGALAAVCMLVPLAWLSLRRGRRREAVVLLLLLLAQPMLGVAMVGTGLALPLAMAHNLVAGALLAMVVRMA